MIINDTGGLGKVEVSTVPMPDFVRVMSATYTYSGKVLVFYTTSQDPKVSDYINIAIANDDGTDFKNIFSGVIKQHKKANGIRHLPFQDNKRVLLGDYVLECYPDIDNCKSVKLVPVKYPWLIHLDPRTTKHWSEVIIAPDNEHICWTILRSDIGAANVMGILQRKRNKYVIKKPQVISTIEHVKKEKKNKGYIILPQIMRGGEVKQFVKGGAAISLVGAVDSPLPNSVVQDLMSGDVIQITNMPGYEETTIFSPDERLGIVMSTRGSKKTNCAIFGLLPRPHAMLTTSYIVMLVYMYAVAGVRSFREGNIGPVLIDIERSMNENGYQGVLLNDPEEKWVYLSPMSWHPGGKKAMWLEMLRGSDRNEGGRQVRIRKAELHDYQPEKPVPIVKTPDDIPYSIKGIRGGLKLWLVPNNANIEGKIPGKHSGYIEYKRRGKWPMQSMIGEVESRYVNYSDDGKNFYNGFERVKYSIFEESTYEADIELSGEQKGEMRLRATFSKIVGDTPPKLLFDQSEDGRPKSFGYAEYNGVRLNIEDMLP